MTERVPDKRVAKIGDPRQAAIPGKPKCGSVSMKRREGGENGAEWRFPVQVSCSFIGTLSPKHGAIQGGDELSPGTTSNSSEAAGTGRLAIRDIVYTRVHLNLRASGNNVRLEAKFGQVAKKAEGPCCSRLVIGREAKSKKQHSPHGR